MDRRPGGATAPPVAFFIDGVRTTADGAVSASHRLLELFATDRTTIEQPP